MQKFQDQDVLKNSVLKELQLTTDKFTELKKKLKDYIFVNDLSDLQSGAFIRTISIEEFELKNPCVFCDVKITADGMSLFCKNLYKPLFFHVSMDKTLVFRRLKADEKLIIAALKTVT